MADTPAAAKPTPGRDYHTMGQPAHEAPETANGRLGSLGIDLGMPLPKGQTKAPVQREPDHGLEVNVEGNEATITRVDASGADAPIKLDAQGKPVVPAGGAEAQETTEAKAAREAAEADAAKVADLMVVPLPAEAFDAAKPESVEAYTKAFIGKDGKGVNMANLTADWQKNMKVDAKTGAISGGLSENTYKFLESQGLDRATVQAVEAGQVARLTADRAEHFNLAGGQEKYEGAIKWAKAGGYDAAGAAKFNSDIAQGGASRKDAIDLLMQRFTKANPTPRKVSPTRTTADAANAGGGDGAGGIKGYANHAEYQVDLRKARATNDQALLDTARARLQASDWFKGKK